MIVKKKSRTVFVHIHDVIVYGFTESATIIIVAL